MKAVAKVTKTLPPWMTAAKAEGAKEAKDAKGGKMPSKAHEKGESKRFEAVEEKAMKGKMANGGKVASTKATATNPKSTARNFPKSAGNAPGNTLHLKNGGKVKAC